MHCLFLGFPVCTEVLALFFVFVFFFFLLVGFTTNFHEVIQKILIIGDGGMVT